MKVFSKERFFNANVHNCRSYCLFESCRAWVDRADGKPVIDGICEGRSVLDEWMKDVYNPVEETGKILNTHFPNGFPEPAPQDTNCRCVCLTSKPPKHPRYKIVIECAADATFATMYVDDELVKVTSANRNPADKFNWRIGAQTAFNRLWEKKKKPVKPVDKYVQLFNEKLTEFAKEEAERIFRRFDKLPTAGRF